jgi:hypothetical protein
MRGLMAERFRAFDLCMERYNVGLNPVRYVFSFYFFHFILFFSILFLIFMCNYFSTYFSISSPFFSSIDFLASLAISPAKLMQYGMGDQDLMSWEPPVRCRFL